MSEPLTVASYAPQFLGTRDNRKKNHDKYLMRLALEIEWFAQLPIADVRPKHVIQLIRELKAQRAPKTITNTISLLTVMFRWAIIDEHRAPPNPAEGLPRGLLSRTFRRTKPYEAREVNALLALRGIHGMLAHLALYTGGRPGEVCGRRWRDYDPKAKPLGGLHISTQWQDQPLKTDDADKTRPRTIPVHDELAKCLREWWEHGYRETYGVDPTQDGFIIPSRNDVTRALTRSGALQLWHQACEIANIDPRELRATRNTFVTFARRGSPREDTIESFTHNSAGKMIDRYCTWLWSPRCDVINTLSFAVREDEALPTFLEAAPTVEVVPAERELNRRIRVRPLRRADDPAPVADAEAAAVRQRVAELIAQRGIRGASEALRISRLAAASIALGEGSTGTLARAAKALRSQPST
jgi:integrase